MPTDQGTMDPAGSIAELQTRIAFHEDEIGHLNQIVEDQRKILERQADEIERLRHIVAALAETLREQIPDARPPHY